jgi:DNA modification methylase
MNQLILGDCLEVMKGMESESIDLIYLDPPFFSNRNYEVIWGDKGEIRSFEDRWSGGIDHYIGWLKERVQEMHRLLKPTGSIYLHCDWHADAYIRVYILDKIFGYNNFRSHIIWKRYNPHQLSKGFDVNSDSIFIYSKSSKFLINNQYNTDEELLISKFPHIEEETNRRYQHVALEQASNSSSKNEVRIVNGKKYYTKLGWRWSQETFDERLKINPRIILENSKGKLRYKLYADEYKGERIGNIWDDSGILTSGASERIGYPTQKPEKLLERIILASSNEGDTVLDPFVGGGTTVVVADKLKRNWIGIDQSVQAIKVSEMRLEKQQDMYSAPFSVILHKYDYDTLRYKNAFEFEKWIVERFDGIANIQQRGDLGMDGRKRDGTPIQVKRSDNIGRNVVDNFHSAVMRYDKNLYEKNKKNAQAVGYIIAFSFGKGAVQEVARLQNEENVIIQLVTVEEIVPIAKKPNLSIEINDLGADAKGIREIEFIAKTDVEVEFFGWDWDYVEGESFKAEVLLDKTGKQTKKFKPGTHTIAVKAIDFEGLEAIEIIKLKVNGVVELQ